MGGRRVQVDVEIRPGSGVRGRVNGAPMPRSRDLLGVGPLASAADLPEVAAWADQYAATGVWARYQAALARHTEAWRAVGERCDFLPTAPQ